MNDKTIVPFMTVLGIFGGIIGMIYGLIASHGDAAAVLYGFAFGAGVVLIGVGILVYLGMILTMIGRDMSGRGP